MHAKSGNACILEGICTRRVHMRFQGENELLGPYSTVSYWQLLQSECLDQIVVVEQLGAAD